MSVILDRLGRSLGNYDIPTWLWHDLNRFGTVSLGHVELRRVCHGESFWLVLARGTPADLERCMRRRQPPVEPA